MRRKRVYSEKNVNNLPIWAEKHFSLKCTEGNAQATKPDEDVNGWDFHVELPPKPYLGAAEEQPPVCVAYVQIKSTIGGIKKAQIKLSNVLKACRQKQPWFVFLITRNQNSSTPELYGLHVWRELMALGLEAVRKADVEGAKLNHKKLTVKFTESDRVNGDVVQWMEGQIAIGAPNYELKKEELANTLGYENGHGVTTITFEEEPEEIALAFLGLRKSIRATQFSFLPVRFGIADKEPKIEEPGKVTISPHSQGKVELRFKGPSVEPSMNLIADVYAFGAYKKMNSIARLRLSAPPVELVWATNEQFTKALLDINWTERNSLYYLSTYAHLADWSRVAPPKLEVWDSDKFLFRGTVTFGGETIISETQFLCTICHTLNEFQSAFLHYNIQLSLHEINAAAKTLTWFVPLLGQGSLRIEFKLPDLNAQNVKSLLYYVTAKVGDWTFSCVVRRKIMEDIIIDGVRRITSGPPIILERFVSQNAGASHDIKVVSAYNHAVAEMALTEETLDFDDMIAFGISSYQNLEV